MSYSINCELPNEEKLDGGITLLMVEPFIRNKPQRSASLSSVDKYRFIMRIDTWAVSIQRYHPDEIIATLLGFIYMATYFTYQNCKVQFTFGLLFVIFNSWTWKRHICGIHREFVWFWCRQLKMITLTMSSLLIVLTDLYWVWYTHSWENLLATIAINATIIFFIQADLSEITLLFRIVLPIVLLMCSGLTSYIKLFVWHDISLWNFRGHTLSLWHLQCFAWSQVFVFSLLALKAIVTDSSREKFYLIEDNLERGEHYKTGGWAISKMDWIMFISCTVCVMSHWLKGPMLVNIIFSFTFLLVSGWFLRDVKMKWTYVLKYRPMLLILSAAVVFVCDMSRHWFVHKPSSIVKHLSVICVSAAYVCAIMTSILSDFHVKATKTFRLAVPVVILTRTGMLIWQVTFFTSDYPVFTLNGHTLGINAVQRNAYLQVFSLLVANLTSLIKDPEHKKFFLITELKDRIETMDSIKYRTFWKTRLTEPSSEKYYAAPFLELKDRVQTV